MGILEFIKFLDTMSLDELQDYLEAYWRGEFELTPQEEWHLTERLRGLAQDPEEVHNYIVVWLVLLALMTISEEAEVEINPIQSIFDRLVPPDEVITDRDKIIWDFYWQTKSCLLYTSPSPRDRS